MASDVCVLGSLNVDVVSQVEALPKPGETIIGLGLKTYAGGKGLNQAIAAARLGASVTMLGATGDDDGGRRLRGLLETNGVDITRLGTLADQPSGQAHICVATSGENTIVVSPGANGAVTPAAAEAARSAAPRVTLCQFETPFEALEAFLAATIDAVRIVNAAPANTAFKPLFEEADFLVVNETELATYSGRPVDPADRAAIIAAALGLIVRPNQTVIVTLGAEGCLAVTPDCEIVVPGHRAKVVDTVGAGDCFCGALAASLARGTSLADALTFANKAAALAVERPGASSMPTLAEVEARA